MHMTISELAEKVRPLAESYNIPKISVFGSFARGEACEDSDIDLIVEHQNNPKLSGWYFFGLEQELTQALNKKVDLITYKHLERSWLKPYVIKDEVVIYEQ